MENLSSHDRKELKRQQKEESEQRKLHEHTSKTKTKSAVKWFIGVFICVAVVFLIFKIFSGNENGSVSTGPYTKGVVHWHAKLFVERCGVPYELPAPVGQSHLGAPLLHTHEDKLIHIEGQIWNKEDISLGNYIKNIGVEKGVLNENPACDNQPAEWKMTLNGKENFELKNYVIQDGDVIELKLMKK